jgi:hypothetical protein
VFPKDARVSLKSLLVESSRRSRDGIELLFARTIIATQRVSCRLSSCLSCEGDFRKLFKGVIIFFVAGGTTIRSTSSAAVISRQ